MNTSTTKELRVIVKNNYGQLAIYPACDQTRMICALGKTKTLTDQQVGILKQNDYTFKNVTPTPTQLEI